MKVPAFQQRDSFKSGTAQGVGKLRKLLDHRTTKDAGMLKEEIPAKALAHQICLANATSAANCYKLSLIRRKGGLQFLTLINRWRYYTKKS